VATSGDTAQLEDEIDNVRFLGRFGSIDDWVKRAPVRSHLLVVFAAHPPGGIGPAGIGPSPEPMLPPQIRFDAGSPFDAPNEAGDIRGLVIRATTAGRVFYLQRLAAPELGSPRAFQVRPMLTDAAVGEFAGLARLVMDCPRRALAAWPSRSA